MTPPGKEKSQGRGSGKEGGTLALWGACYLFPCPWGLTWSPSLISEFKDCWEKFVDHQGESFPSWEKLEQYSESISRRLSRILRVRCWRLLRPPPNPFPASALPSVWRSSSLLSCHCPPFLSFFSRYPLLLLSPRGSQFLPSLRSETLISSWVLTPFFFLSQHFQHHSSSSFCSFTVSRQSKLSRVSLQQFANQNNLEDSFRDLRLGSPSPSSSRSDSR